MSFKTWNVLWEDTTQRQLLRNLQFNSAPPAFIPCDDRRSFAAYRTSLSEVLGLTLSFNFWLVLPIVIPIHGIYWWLKRIRTQPGWHVDWIHLRVQAVGQKNVRDFQLSADMELLAHHRQIDITHPTAGPVLTLFTAAASNDPLDQKAQENLARTLADTLKLRLVGCRVALK